MAENKKLKENKTLKNKNAHDSCHIIPTLYFPHKIGIGQSQFSLQEKVDIVDFYLTHDLADADLAREILRDKYGWKNSSGKLNSTVLLNHMLQEAGLSNSICFLRSDSIDDTLVKMGFVNSDTVKKAKNNVVERQNLRICIECPRGVLKWRYKSTITEDEELKFISSKNSNSPQEEEDDETNDQHEAMLSCLFRHIRNSFAHNNTYFFENGNLLLIDFDSKNKVSAMLLIRQQTLLDWRALIIAGPQETEE